MHSSSCQPRFRRLRFEPLESRQLLSITVDTLVDENDGVGVGTGTSLREAITAAAAGDTINFSVNGTIKLTSGSLPTINKNLTIVGPGASLLTIDANDPTSATKNGDGGRVFTIRDNNYQHLIDVSISGLTLTAGDTNTVVGGGGAISSYENLVVSDCVIAGNGSGYGNNYGGGAIQSIPEGDQFGGLPNSLSVRNTILSGNTSLQGEGGAIRKRLGPLLVEDCVITGNSAYWDGGGVSASDSVSVQINRSIISNNRTTYSNNTNYGNGGGVFVFDGTGTISDSTISGNTAQNGGGLFGNPSSRPGYLIVTDSTISGNSALVGGGIDAMAGAQITNSTLSNNTATARGGAIYGAFVTIKSTTITSNTSPAAAQGAARLSGASSSPSKISSSIIAGNTNGDFSLSNTTSLGYNLVGAGTGTFNKTGDQTGVTNPMLGPLADNGGPTKTHAPLPGSPALDTGDPNFNPANPDGNPNTNDALPFDQRGAPFTRVYDGDGAGGARIDKGAVERQPVSSVVMGDYDQNGSVDAGDYLLWRKMQGATGVTPYTAADGSGNGSVGTEDFSLWRSHYGSSVPAAGAGSGASVEGGVGNAKANSALAEPVARTERASNLSVVGSSGEVQANSPLKRQVVPMIDSAISTAGQASSGTRALLGGLILLRDGRKKESIDSHTLLPEITSHAVSVDALDAAIDLLVCVPLHSNR